MDDLWTPSTSSHGKILWFFGQPNKSLDFKDKTETASDTGAVYSSRWQMGSTKRVHLSEYSNAWLRVALSCTPTCPLACSIGWKSVATSPMFTKAFMHMSTSSPRSPIESLCFKEDISNELQNRPLYLSDEENQLPGAQKDRIGPIVDREWWRGSERIQADRATRSLCVNIKLVPSESLVRLRISPPRDIDTNSSFARSSQQDVPEIHRLLEKCIAAVPRLALIIIVSPSRPPYHERV
ncbi:uncharacterized protein ARMOST_02844 [Armillaria ostoyae]|uniref:Uncharacterized protein n=1 Tax=Armillaria ostoyae TaxID=47428 RepID=A0A284QSV4_ARMOS|nr:uncharacterized protein ARMOST_02844 [Armillaria ostoyae]